MSTGKNGKIEFMRFVFCMSVLLYHGQLHYFVVDKKTMHLAFFARGYIGVEFFFLVTGFLMAKSVYKRINIEGTVSKDLGYETLYFTFRKIKAIFPYHIVAFIILFIAQIFIKHYSPAKTVKAFLDMIPSLLLIQKTGFNYSNLNSVEWYISCMIFAVMILYPICRRYYSMFVHVIAPVGGVFLLGYLAYTYGSFTETSRWTGIVFACMMRAIAEIGFGAVTFEISRVLGSMRLTTGQKKGLTIIEWGGWIFAFLFIMSTVKTKYEIYAVFAMMAAISLTFSNQVCGNKWFNNRFCYLLGEWSLPVYLSQVFALDIIDNCLQGLSGGKQIIILVVLTLFNAMVCKGLVKIFGNAYARYHQRHTGLQE